MSPVAIPPWNVHGVLPPRSSATARSSDRSPYVVSLADLVRRFATSQERIDILHGFLDFRAGIHAAGLSKGFQWLNGSFLEDIELIERRSPRDIDVVTFYHLPAGTTQQTLLNSHPQVFDFADTKSGYHVDSYFVELTGSYPESLVKSAAYWYSVWSHRRNDLWKGYLQVGLQPGEDGAARAALAGMHTTGGQP